MSIRYIISTKLLIKQNRNLKKKNYIQIHQIICRLRLICKSFFMTLSEIVEATANNIATKLMRRIKRLQANICTQSDLGEVYVVAPFSGLRPRAPKGVSPREGKGRIRRRVLAFSMRSRIPRGNTCLLRR